MLTTIWAVADITSTGGTIEGLPWQGWLGIVGTCVALLSWGVSLIARGKLVPLSTHQRELDAAAAAVEKAEHDGNEWRAEGRIKDAQLAEKDKQLAEKDKQLTYMREVGETSKATLSALQRLAESEVTP